MFNTVSVSQPETEDFRLYFYKGADPISPFHDIPLWVNKDRRLANMIVEIPKGTRAKLEISGSDPLNPIKQDTKGGKLRYVHDPYPFNYGAFPQTWENPHCVCDYLKAKGDNDPIDAVEIGSKIHKTGEVVQVLILGAYGMLDDGEADWKILCIDITDPLCLAGKFKVPESTRDIVFKFLRDYKIPDGKPPNKFGFKNQLKCEHFAAEITQKCHEEWEELIAGKIESKISKVCTKLDKSACPHATDPQHAKALIHQEIKKSKI